MIDPMTVTRLGYLIYQKAVLNRPLDILHLSIIIGLTYFLYFTRFIDIVGVISFLCGNMYIYFYFDGNI